MPDEAIAIADGDPAGISASLQPLVHIGYHKTASTLLQDELFTDPALGFHRLRDDRKRIHRLFVLRGPLERLSAAEVEELRQEAEEAAQSGLRLVVSHERLSGYFATGGFDQSAISHRLKQAFPEAHILIVIREQRAMLRSAYQQYVVDGGYLSFDRFATPTEPHMLRVPAFDPDYFAYDGLVAHYRDLFGAENVKVMPSEALRRDATGFVADLMGFALGHDPDVAAVPDLSKVSVNSAKPLWWLAVMRRTNGLLGRNQLANHSVVGITGLQKALTRMAPRNRLGAGLDRRMADQLNRKVERLAEGRYGASNRRLAEMIGIDLGALGYDMG